MLRITQQSAPAAAKSYYSHADYYGDGLESVGRWGGKGAERLGLTGQVGKAAFDALCDNRTPGTGDPLTARTRTARTVGYDFTFSVPKSVSLAYAVGGDDRVLDAFRAAVAETMADVEAEMKARVRKRGADAERTTGNAVWAEFVHLTSRPVGGVPDPHLHAHCFVFNATFDDREDIWKAGQFRDLKKDAPYWQAAFRVRLADRLQDLGYQLTRTRDDFELAGVSPDVVARFSRRTGEIEAAAEERGITDPERKAELGAKTRQGKADRLLSRRALTAVWTSRLTPAEAAALRPGEPATHANPPDRAAAAVDFAARHLFERQAVVPERTLLTEALKAGLGEVTVAGVARAAKAAGLLEAEHDGRRVVTTRGVLAEEERLLAFARDGRGTRRPLGPPGWAVRRGWLNEGQKRAVEHVLASRDRVTLLTGRAGTGKTTLMQEAVEAIEAAGKRVVVLAPSAAASRGVLRGEGFAAADTVAAFLARRKLQQTAAGQVIWVDEAGLLGTRDLAALFDVARAVDARVVLMGDRAQHGSVARGSPLRLLQTEAGLPAVAVTDIVRQAGDYKGAVRLLADGRTDDGLAALDRLGWVREVADPAERYGQMAAAYREATVGGKSALVVTPTHAEAARITAAVRRDLAAANKLGDPRPVAVLVPKHLTAAERERADSYAAGDVLQFHKHTKGHPAGSRAVVGADPLPLAAAERFSVYRPATIELAAGDRVRVTANGTTKDGHRLTNGALYTLTGFTPAGDLVLDNGWVVGRDFGHLAHGYAVTSHASQGKTVDRVIVGQAAESFPASDRRQFYVSVSRGRERAVVFTDDKAGLAAAVARGGEGATATEVFRRRPRPAVEWLARHLNQLRRAAAQMMTERADPAREPEREGRYG
jgi:conjugative relaxase-like TrwC/TraI family protein